MKPMNNLFHLLDLKLSIAGLAFLAVSVSSLDVSLKILGSILFIGFNIRRWYIMEKNHKQGNHDKNQ
ncbi:hypothetical protein GCM10028861_00280 [Flavobacterium koreense]